LGVVVVGILIFSAIKAVLDIPTNWAKYVHYRNRARGLRALTLGLSAVAAGDARGAVYYARKAKDNLAAKEALPKLLEAQAARLNGDEPRAAALFHELLEHREASFLGLRGLLQAALERGDYAQGLTLARRAQKAQPKQEWVLKTLYELEIKQAEWTAAVKTLNILERSKYTNPAQAKSARVAIMMARALESQAAGDITAYRKALGVTLRLDSVFIPAIIALARLDLEQGRRRSAVRLLEKSWKQTGHPALIPLWQRAQESAGLSPIKSAEKLLALRPDSMEARLTAAQAFMQERLWGEARKALEQAQEIRPSAALYQLWALLEERATGNREAVRAWQDRALGAALDFGWVCRETGRVYDHWVPVSDKGLFNTIHWAPPLPAQPAVEVYSIVEESQPLHLPAAP
jgi:HemY protein